MSVNGQPKIRQPGIFGQLSLDIYTSIILGSRIPEGTSQDAVQEVLDKASLRLTKAFPFLAGKVVKEARSSTYSGTYKIVPHEANEGKSLVVTKDRTKDCPMYDEYIAAKAPFSMLDSDLLCPMKEIGYSYTESDVTPVLIIQANFVKGGLLLCFCGQHNAMDITGQGQVVRLFASACRGQDFDPQDVAVGNQDADTIIPLLKDGEVPLKHETLRKPSTLVQDGPSDPDPLAQVSAPWKYWRFPNDQLPKLKAQASGGSAAWISTNDAMSAFYTQRLTAARLAAGRIEANDAIKCLRAVNARAKLNPPVPKGYMGNLVALIEAVWPAADQMINAPLSTVASDLRASLGQVDDFYIRSLATLIHHETDRTTLEYGAQTRPGRDVVLSSWAELSLSACDFGPLLSGHADFFRRPALLEMEGLSFLMPKTREGHVDLAASLAPEDVDALNKDEAWAAVTEFVG